MKNCRNKKGCEIIPYEDMRLDEKKIKLTNKLRVVHAATRPNRRAA